MSKRTVFTTVTPLPPGVTRETVMETLRSHTEMIDLNPLVEERHPIKPPPNASPEEYHCQWYSLTDKVQYLPGGMMSGKVTYTACFHDLASGLQTHVYAPLGLNIKGKWTLGGSLPGEPIAPVELGVGAPLTGLWLREDVDMKCNFMMTSFVKGTLKKAHSTLVSRLMMKAQIVEAVQENARVEEQQSQRGGGNYSPTSEVSAQSFSDRSRVESWAASTIPSNTPPPPLGSYEDEKFNGGESSLHPKPLSIRSSSSTVSGQRPIDGRVSWNSLNQSSTRSPPVQHAQLGGYRAPSPYQAPPPGDLRREGSWHSQSQQGGGYGSPAPCQYQQPPPPQYQQQQHPNQYQQHPGAYAQQQQHQQPVEMHAPTQQEREQAKTEIYEMA